MILIILHTLLILAILYYLFNSYNKNYNYWKQKGVAQLKNQHLIYGDMKALLIRKKSPAETVEDMYYKFKQLGVEHGGIYFFNRPQWLPVSPSIIKLVINKGFRHFSAHHPKLCKTRLFNNIFHMDGEPWKDICMKLSPTFTSGKIKIMVDMLLKKTTGLNKLVETLASSGQPVEIKEIVARFATDVFGTCGFGIEYDSLKDINSVFFHRSQDIFRRLDSRPTLNLFTAALTLLGFRKYFVSDLQNVEDFFRNIIRDTIAFREKNKLIREDFLNLMIQLKNNGTITDIVDKNDVFLNTVSEDSIAMEDIADMCMFFYGAGFQTTSTTLSYALLELARNQYVQATLRKEIREVLRKHNGALTYDALQEMDFCDNVVQETLRKYPPLPTLSRLCAKDYKIPNTDLTIEKGTVVNIPIFALQNDPEYFPRPEKFFPHRFSAENKSKIVEYTFMPFGDCSQQCLGMRLGLMQVKSGLASLINRYHFSLDSKSTYPPTFSPKSQILSVEGSL